MSTTDLAQQVADLTTATTQLTQEVVGQKARLTAAADTATGKASDASGSASAASASATSANAAAAEAETSKNQAAEIAGLDTVEEAIDLTLAKTLGLMTETEAMAQADAYEQMFAASGMVHMGKQIGSSTYPSVNEGINTSVVATSYSNQFIMGSSYTQNLDGTSETNFGVTYIAGAVANVLHNEPVSSELSWFNLPPAEAGTRVYDSTGDVRGSGEATLDFRFDQDPKYGNAPSGTEAEILREAVGRAFEGDIKGGDGRLGVSDWALSGAVASFVVNSDGWFVLTQASDQTWRRASQEIYTAGEYDDTVVLEFEAYATNVGAGYGVIDIARGITSTPTTSGEKRIQLTDVPTKYSITLTGTGNYPLYFNLTASVSDAATHVRNITVRKVTEEVVTHRSDVATWESYDEELTGRKEIMECIQSLSTTFGDTDVPTVLSTRPNSYFDQYDGQSDDPDAQNTKYRCVVWDDLTDEQKRKVAAYMGNKLYVGENGNLVNRRLRARTFRGLGNGDWQNISSVGSGVGLRFENTTNFGMVQPQGIKDSAEPYNSDNYAYSYVCPQHSYSSDTSVKGVFTPRVSNPLYPASVGYKGRCFLYVVASVPRANQGAYYPNLNEYGTGYCRDSAQPDSQNHGDLWWQTPFPPLTEAECFDPNKVRISGGGNTWGKIGGLSGHPDGIFYDGITAGGLNGVIDWRLPAVANDTPEEQAKVQGKVENKTFRGLEKLVSTKVFSGLIDVFDASQFTSRRLSLIAGDITQEAKAWVGENQGYDVPDDEGKLPVLGYLINDNTKDIYPIHNVNITSVTSEFRFNTTLEGYNSAYADNGVPWSLVLYSETQSNLSVSGEFNTQMVIGDPANLVQVDALKDGWLGTWGGLITSGVNPSYTRKALGVSNRVYTYDNGVTWTSNTQVFDQVKNINTQTYSTSLVAILPYTAYAKVTEPCENKPVYGVDSGVMSVLTSNSHEAESATFFESLLGKVPTHSGDVTYHEYLAVRKVHFEDDGRLKNTDSGNRNILHEPTMLTHLSDTPALKVLPYQIAENEQCFIGYQANELAYDSPSIVNITSGSMTVDMVVGTVYKVSGNSPCVMAGKVWLCVKAAATDWDNATWYVKKNGAISAGTTADDQWLIPFETAGWGDDDKIKVTADGSDTFVDLNGNTNLSVSHKTTMPTGWTKNRARIGEQVEGVDL